MSSHTIEKKAAENNKENQNDIENRRVSIEDNIFQGNSQENYIISNMDQKASTITKKNISNWWLLIGTNLIQITPI